MNIRELIREELKNSFEKIGYDVSDVIVAFSSKPDDSDFQCNSVFALSKKFHENPEVVAGKIIDNISEDFKNNVAEVFFAKPGFINFKIKDKVLSEIANEALLDENLCLKKLENPIKVVMDYGGANVAKELHIGHLRSPVIGESLARLYKLLGNEVITDTHLGDWGLQMGLTIAQLEDDGYISGYFNKNKENKTITLDTLNEEYPKASKRKTVDENFRVKAETYTKYVQDKVEPYWSIYNEIRNISVEKIRENYEKLNCYFDLWYGESTSAKFVDAVVEKFVDMGLTKSYQGALIVDVAREGENVPIPKKSPDEVQKYKNPMPPVYLKKSNGADVYDTTDIATIYQRNNEYNPDKIMYVVDKRQGTHFEHCFRAVKMAKISSEEQVLQFVGYGTINGTDGKPFKTRSGDTIKLEDIINLISSEAEKRLTSNGITDSKELALKIGVAAMKFGDLSNDPGKDYIFDIEKFVSFEGKTGPYIQYTGARINSLLKKSGSNDFVSDFEKEKLIDISDKNQRNLIISFLKLQESYYLGYNATSLSPIANALYDFSSAYSKFYNDTKILTETDSKKKSSYLALSYFVLKTLKQASWVLAFDIPEKM